MECRELGAPIHRHLASHLEALVSGINGHRDGANGSHGTLEVSFTPDFDKYAVGEGSS